MNFHDESNLRSQDQNKLDVYLKKYISPNQTVYFLKFLYDLCKNL